MATPDLLNPPPASSGNALLDAFPRRRLAVYYAGAPDNTLTLAGMAIVFVLLALLCMGMSLPDIARDASMSRAGKAVVDDTAQIDGDCRRMKFIFVDCNVKITYRPDPEVDESATVDQSFLFLGSSYNTSIDVLRSTVYPERVTTSLATEHLGNRIFTLLGLLAAFAALTWFCARQAWRSQQRLRLEGKKMVMRPLIVHVRSTDRFNNVRFEASIDGVSVKQANRLREGDVPFWLPGTPGMALAVALPDSPLLILMDQDMTVLAFTDPERKELRAALA